MRLASRRIPPAPTSSSSRGNICTNPHKPTKYNYIFYLELCEDRCGPGDLGRHDARALVLLGEEGRHEDEGDGADPESVAEPSSDQAGHSKPLQSGQQVAQPHGGRGEGDQQEERRVQYPAV